MRYVVDLRHPLQAPCGRYGQVEWGTKRNISMACFWPGRRCVYSSIDQRNEPYSHGSIVVDERSSDLALIEIKTDENANYQEQ
jgi:hypothetical protein